MRLAFSLEIVADHIDPQKKSKKNLILVCDLTLIISNKII
jgi:hypothetical protein